MNAIEISEDNEMRKEFKVSFNEEDSKTLLEKIKRDTGGASFSEWVRHKMTGNMATQSLKYYNPRIEEEYLKLPNSSSLVYTFNKIQENRIEIRHAQQCSAFIFKVSTGLHEQESHEERVVRAADDLLDIVMKHKPIARFAEPMRVDLATLNLNTETLLVYYCFIETDDGMPVKGRAMGDDPMVF
jgi:hypothetical protein